ncbi:MAG: NAD(P)-dependent alcohol dehydrogenase [Brevirhabdus sp.]
MKAVTYDQYGESDVLNLETLPRPEPGPGEILVRVRASSVTTADWRLRASAFPGILWLPGRLMTGLCRPKNRVLGVEFAGDVAEVGKDVTDFNPGDAVHGFSGHGAHAEYLVIKADGPVVRTPDRLRREEAAVLAFGAVSALVFLRDQAKLQPGQSVLIVGGSGGVGVYAIQIAKAMGARVTAVASGENQGLMRDLGADHVVDYHRDEVAPAGACYDLIFDTVGVVDFPRARAAMCTGGLFLPLNFGGREILRALWPFGRKGRRIKLAVSGDTKADLLALNEMIWEGQVRPVIDRVFPLTQVRAAHDYVEARHRKGSVVLGIA